MKGIARLKGVVKHYDWGGAELIPSLLQIDNKEGKPFAEYWMGTHSLGQATIELNNNEAKELSSIDQLPFLLKLLDVKDMLSIQVHPSKTAAEKDFARENEAGIPLDSANRNYKDANHKPELMVALSDFWLLHGFKPSEELIYTLLNVVELRELLPVFNQSGYSGLYKHVMEMPQAEVNRLLQPLIDNISSVYDSDGPDKSDEDFWAARAAKTFNKDGNIDRGIFSIYLFNLVHLKKGEGIFQDAGVPHAYLEGQNVEIMANSDNVLRGGLTTKHIDVTELLKHVKCEATYPNILSADSVSAYEKIYKTPVPDFVLSVFELEEGMSAPFTPVSTEILVLIEGKALISDNTDTIEVEPGEPAAAIFAAEHPIFIKAASKTTIFRAAGNVHSGE
ncbi:MAG TPA: mannose-6-phosphate isomerase, class I [Chitinophagaceae bacterium]